MQPKCLAAVVSAILLLLVPAYGEIILAYSIQRHGARNVLPKSALLTESDASGGPTLLPAGGQMCYEAGVAFHQRYISQTTCAASRPATCLSKPGHEQYGVYSKPGIGFHNYNALAGSSGLDRTLLSAESFLSGVFPAASLAASSNSSSGVLQAVPVYSSSDSEDWLIRGYSKCPAYLTRLAAWLRSDAFKQKEAESAALRQKVQEQAPQLNTSLATWWDVFDSFNVWRTYGVGNPMPPMDNATFAQVNQLAMWLETSKMDPQLTGNLLGGALLGDMLQRMATAEQAVLAGSQAPYYKLRMVSSHYNTQLGVLSALQAAVPASQRTQYLWASKIPSLAAVLVFELHKSPSGQLVVRTVFQDGSKAAYKVLPLPCAVAGDAAEGFAGPGSCTLQGFRAIAGPQALNGSGDWCDACSNEKVLACAVRSMERQLMAVGVAGAGSSKGGGAVTGSSSSGKMSPAMIGLISAVVVLGVLAFVGIGGLGVQKLRQRKAAGLPQQLGKIAGVQDVPVSLSRHAPV